MNIKKKLIDDYLAYISSFTIILLFPGFALYNTLVAYGFITPIFGGFFGLFSVIYLILVLPMLLRLPVFLDNKSLGYFIILIFLYVYIFLFSTTNYLLDSRAGIEDAYFQIIETMTLTLAIFFIGFFVDLNQKIYKILLYTILVSAALLLFYFLKTGQVMFYAKSFADDNATEYVSTYQGYARSAIITSLIVLSMTNRLARYLFIYMLSIFILFILGARSEFVGLVLSGTLLLLLRFKINIIQFLKLLSFCVLGLIVLYFSYDSFSGGRGAQVFDLANDTSWEARKSLEQIGLNQIIQHPILGYFGGHILEGGSRGSYIHNVLSVWAGFGLISFILYVLLCFIPFFHCILIALKDKQQTDKFYFCLSLSSVVVLLILFSKSFFWVLPGFVWGLYLSINRSRVK
ncbi:hypothetical protein [Psychrobacter sp. LFX-11D]|uniref:hypothetical protein n=1 Tax=Psychrobacter sp. LFX-11D TaxID=458201 RepID=UPI001919A5BB|nr:hypothetical protein [Psychrobacter sp. LFX-11D]